MALFAFLNNHFLGVRIWIWMYFAFSLFAGISIAVYWHREKIRKLYYRIRFPEKLLKCIVHYKSGLYKVYWRIIPDKDFFVFEGKQYIYSDKSILKENDFFARKTKDDLKFTVDIEGKSYNLTEYYGIKRKGKKYPEIHYFFNYPNPVIFNYEKHNIEFSASQLDDFKENDLFNKLLTLEAEKRILIFLFLLVIGNFLATLVILAKMMNWIK